MPSGAAATRYTVTDLGTLGGANSDAAGINASGQVTGNSPASGIYHAFLYSNGVMTDAGTLGGSESYGNAINDNGLIAGQSRITGNTTVHAFVRDGMSNIDLGTLSGGAYSAAFAINPEGVVAGESGVTGGNIHAFRFSYPGGTMVDLGTLPGGTTSAAYGIASNGLAVGSSNLTGGATHAASFYLGGVVDLGTLPGGARSVALDVNNNFRVVGRSDLPPIGGLGRYHAILIDSNLVIKDLGTLGGTISEARSINDSGAIVGTSQTSGDSRFHAFIYKNGALQDLNDLQAVGSTWVLEYANGINESGQIVGSGTNPAGYSHAFLLTPFDVPAPTVKIVGKKKITTSSGRLQVKGSAQGEVDSVSYTIGKKHGTANGTTKWKFSAKLKPGKNKITVIAHGFGGNSKPAKITITRE